MSKIVVCPNCLQVNKIPTDREITKANCGKCKSSLLDTKPREVDFETFNKHIINNDILVIVDFFATWCGPCKALAPTFEKVSSFFPLKARFLKVDTDKVQTLSQNFGIRGVPSILLFSKGVGINRVSGALSESDLKNFINQYI